MGTDDTQMGQGCVTGFWADTGLRADTGVRPYVRPVARTTAALGVKRPGAR